MVFACILRNIFFWHFFFLHHLRCLFDGVFIHFFIHIFSIWRYFNLLIMGHVRWSTWIISLPARRLLMHMFQWLRNVHSTFQHYRRTYLFSSFLIILEDSWRLFLRMGTQAYNKRYKIIFICFWCSFFIHQIIFIALGGYGKPFFGMT